MTALIELVESPRGAAVERRLLGGRATGGDALEGVPKRRVAGAHLVDREITLKIAALGTEQFDAQLDIRPPRGGPGFGIGWRCQRAKIERRAAIEHAADLDRDIRAFRQLRHARAPSGVDFVLAAGI